MINRKALKEKYQDEKVYVIPAQNISHIPDKFNPEKHSPKIWKMYDNMGKYLLRYEVEQEPSLQQLIPYFLIFNHNQTKVFVAKRTDGDHRLVDKYSLGFGGHINECDGYIESVFKCLCREMFEEVTIDPISSFKYMGTMRDITSSTNDHLGLIFNILSKEEDVSIKETDKLIGEWMTYEQLYDNYSKFENWSKYILDYFYENDKS